MCHSHSKVTGSCLGWSCGWTCSSGSRLIPAEVIQTNIKQIPVLAQVTLLGNTQLCVACLLNSELLLHFCTAFGTATGVWMLLSLSRQTHLCSHKWFKKRACKPVILCLWNNYKFFNDADTLISHKKKVELSNYFCLICCKLLSCGTTLWTLPRGVRFWLVAKKQLNQEFWKNSYGHTWLAKGE